MKKILWLASWYPNKIAPFNGDFIQRHAEAAALYQAVYLIYVVKDEHAAVTSNVSVEHFSRGNLVETIAYYKPYETGIRSLDRIISIVTYFRVFKKLIISFIRVHGVPPLVHVHVAMWAGIMALWMKREYRTPYMVTENWTGYYRNAHENIYNKGWIFRNINRRILKKATLFLPVSSNLGNLVRNNFSRVAFKVVPNVVNTSYFSQTSRPTSPFRFLHVSSMNHNKNVEGIFHVFSRLLIHHKNWKLILVGPKPTSLVTLANQLGLDTHIEWKGEIPYSQVAKEMAESSALVMFSRSENLPCVVLEALCTGLPVITSDVGGIPEVITPANGILVSSQNEPQLLQALIDMLANFSAYDATGIRADALARYNYNAVGKTFDQLYVN